MPTRHPTTAHWTFPPDDRVPLGGEARRVSLRELAARPGRFEHHLMVVATVGDAQLEIATASEPLYFAHRNISDEYALPMPTGDAMADAMPFRVFLTDFDTGQDVARINHKAGQLVLHPHGLLHWPGRLRPPYATFDFAAGMRRCGYSVVFCGNRPLAPAADRPVFVSAGCESGPKSYAADRDVPFVIADTASESARAIAAVGNARMALVVAPGELVCERGGYALILAGDAPHCSGDLVYLPPGATVDATGVARALVVTSADADAAPPPPSWDEVPAPPFAVYEDAAPGALPVSVGGLVVDAPSDAMASVRIGDGPAVEVPRYWLARMLFRLALHGFGLGYLETYGGFYYDDTDGTYRLGLRDSGAIELTRSDVAAAVERLYRAVAPNGYVERLT